MIAMDTDARQCASPRDEYTHIHALVIMYTSVYAIAIMTIMRNNAPSNFISIPDYYCLRCGHICGVGVIREFPRLTGSSFTICRVSIFSPPALNSTRWIARGKPIMTCVLIHCRAVISQAKVLEHCYQLVETVGQFAQFRVNLITGKALCF